jgi:hypothetical protein
MPSSPSPLLGVELQALGENLNTWGDTKLNDVIKRLEEAIAGAVSIAVEANVSLTSTDYVQNQARYAMLIFTGTGGFNITCPATAKMYLVKNSCAAAVTFTHGSGTTVSVGAGAIKWVATDGSDFFTAEEIDYLPLAGGTLTGALTLSGAPTSSLHAATKAYADLMIPLAGGTPTGLINYGSDLSGSYTDRSLVDKAYVSSVALGSVSVSFAWADVTGKPTTIAGYGITDAYTKTETDAAYQPLDSDLTSIAALTTTARGRSELTTPNAAHIDNTDSPYAASFGEEIFVDCSTGAVEVDLPAATAGSLPIIITDDDGESVTNNITVDPDGSETIAGQTTIEIDQARASIKLVPFAGVWRIEK